MCPVIRIGITEPVPDWDDERPVEKTLAYLRERLPGYRIEAVALPNTGLEEALESAVEKRGRVGRPDFLISSASTYLQVAWSLGAHRIVHKRSASGLRDPRRADVGHDGDRGAARAEGAR